MLRMAKYRLHNHNSHDSDLIRPFSMPHPKRRKCTPYQPNLRAREADKIPETPRAPEEAKAAKNAAADDDALSGPISVPYPKGRKCTPQQPSLEASVADTIPEAPRVPEEAKAATNAAAAAAGDDDAPSGEANIRKHFCTCPLIPENSSSITPADQKMFDENISLKYGQEFAKPGGGLLTLDFVTLGMSFIGECSELIFLSFYQTESDETSRSLLQIHSVKP